MKLTFDYYHNLEQVDLFLCNPDGRELFSLPGKSRNLTLRFNDLSELTFEVDSKITLSNNTVVDLEAYDYIQTKRLVYATNIGWFQISGVDEHDNGVVKYKTVKAESYQSVLKNKGFVSEERVYCFYNPNDPHDDRYDSTKEDSIPSVLGQWSKQLGVKQALSQGLSEPTTPYDDWTVTYIHSSLIYAGAGSKCRTFKESVTYGYDWMVNDVEEAFEVVILFDFMYKTIHVMTPNEVAQRVNVIYTFNNFMKSVDINEASEDIVTVLNCNGDNCDITAVNPTGTNYICDFSYYMDKTNYRWMSSALITKLEQWKAACDAEKDTYERYVEDIRTAYQSATEKETLLKEMSLSLADLRTAQNKRTVLGSGEPGKLCGIVTAESVKSYRTNINGVETVVGGRSIMPGTDYHSTDFTGAKTITAYQYSPKYNDETRQWDWSQAGATKTGTADEIVAFNLSDDNLSGISYWYFPDASDSSSYCKLQSAVTVNKNSATSTYYCGGFDRYIAYTYPSYVGNLPRKSDLLANDMTTLTIDDLLNDVHNTAMSWSDIKAKYSIADDAGGTTVYTDKISVWINLRETRVKELNIELYGYGFTPSGYQWDYKKTVDTKDGFIYVTTGSGGKLLPTDDSFYGRINTLQSQISSISSRLNILSYFADTPTLLRELNCYWIEGDYTNENIAVLEETTPEEEIDLANELLDAGYIELSKVCQPRFSFSIESRDATKQYEFKDQMRLLELGKIITIEKEEGLWYYPALLEISLNLDNSEEFSMTFANAMRLDDWGYTYADLISDASSTSRKVSANWQDILAYSKERAEISSLIKDPLDTTLRASFANMVNQEFTVDKNGILGRKKVSETSDEFEDEQVRLINNLLIFTDDNWETAKTALGKIYYTDDDGNQVTSYGLIAETIIGSLIMGERLKIRNNNSSVVIDGTGISIIKKVTNSDGSVTETPVLTATSDGEIYVSSYTTDGDINKKLESYVTSESLTTTLSSYTTDGDINKKLESYVTSESLTTTLSSYTTDGDINKKLESYITSTQASATFAAITAGSVSTFGYTLNATEFTLSSNGTTVMKVTSSGLEIEGKVTATDGKVAGWEITPEAILYEYFDYANNDVQLTGMATTHKESYKIPSLINYGKYSYPRFYAGCGLRADGNYTRIPSDTESTDFVVLEDGSIYARAMQIAKYDDASGNCFVDVDGQGMIITNHLGTGGSATLNVERSGSRLIGGVIYGQFSVGSNHYLWLYADRGGELQGTWSTESEITVDSDANLKHDVTDLADQYDTLFDLLHPVCYKYNNGTSGRIHTGFIAQDVITSIERSGLTTQDVAAVCKLYAGSEQDERWALRYGEFISLNTWQIQKLKQRVAELEVLVAKLTNKE